MDWVRWTGVFVLTVVGFILVADLTTYVRLLARGRKVAEGVDARAGATRRPSDRPHRILRLAASGRSGQTSASAPTRKLRRASRSSPSRVSDPGSHKHRHLRPS